MNGTKIDCSLPQHFPSGTEKKTITIIFHASKRNPPDQVTLFYQPNTHHSQSEQINPKLLTALTWKVARKPPRRGKYFQHSPMSSVITSTQSSTPFNNKKRLTAKVMHTITTILQQQRHISQCFSAQTSIDRCLERCVLSGLFPFSPTSRVLFRCICIHAALLRRCNCNAAIPSSS